MVTSRHKHVHISTKGIQCEHTEEEIGAKYEDSKQQKKTENFECCICFDARAMAVKVSSCGHEFCSSCIFKTYTQVSKRCPLCRETFPDTCEEYKPRVIQNAFDEQTPKEFQENFTWVCSIGNLKNVKKCVENEADIHRFGIFGRSPLYASCQNGHLSSVKYLVQNGANVNQTLKSGVSPLWISAQNGYFSIVKFLITQGADVNQATEMCGSPLTIATQHGHHSIVKFLIKNGANVNQTLKNGATPLFLSCLNGHFESVKVLVQNGANINHVLPNGDTALSVSSVRFWHIANYLLTQGALYATSTHQKC